MSVKFYSNLVNKKVYVLAIVMTIKFKSVSKTMRVSQSELVCHFGP